MRPTFSSAASTASIAAARRLLPPAVRRIGLAPASLAARRSFADVPVPQRGRGRGAAAVGPGSRVPYDTAVNERFADDSRMAQLSAVEKDGFVIDSIFVPGAVLIYGPLTFLLEIETFDDLSVDSLALFSAVQPPDLLVFGCGEQSRTLPQDLVEHCRSKSIAFEMVDTRAAAGTYNVLSQEARSVAAILIPPVPYSLARRAALVRETKASYPEFVPGTEEDAKQ